MLALPGVTLCAASSVNVAATQAALLASMAAIDFGACILFTDAPVRPADPRIRIVPIARLASAAAYSQFMLGGLADHVTTPHCLIVQWDGHVLRPGAWDPAFLAHDYVGASWPQFGDGHDVGNGGFSLRSLRLLRACRAGGLAGHPEDVVIARQHRAWLEQQGLHFADRALADRFSAERAGDPLASFGFHGVWHMPHVLGVERFWQIYRTLDERSTIRQDLTSLLQQVARGRGGMARVFTMLKGCAMDSIQIRNRPA